MSDEPIDAEDRAIQLVSEYGESWITELDGKPELDFYEAVSDITRAIREAEKAVKMSLEAGGKQHDRT